ncbi:MAG: hypothetical protein QOD42_3753 [Sphingomonadales bacterium]|jgi:hypothetical protein|nr:hypothetical protein [Sphingomonadales bacterium]
MRTLLLVIAFILLICVVLVLTGVIHLNRDPNGSITLKTPDVTINSADGNGSVTLKADDVTVGTTTTNVQVPVVRTETRQVQVPSVTTNSQ